MSASSDPVRLWLRSRSGAHLPCCADVCLERLVGATLGQLDVALHEGDVDAFGDCAHCAWCGTLLASDAVCVLHDENRGCPPFRWEVTEVGRAAVLEVRTLTQVRTLTPRAFAVFSEVAGYQRMARRYPDLRQLVDGVLDRRVDWLT